MFDHYGAVRLHCCCFVYICIYYMLIIYEKNRILFLLIVNTPVFMLNMHEMYIIKSGPKRACRKGSTENITGPKKTGPKTKVGRKVTHP